MSSWVQDAFGTKGADDFGTSLLRLHIFQYNFGTYDLDFYTPDEFHGICLFLWQAELGTFLSQLLISHPISHRFQVIAQ